MRKTFYCLGALWALSVGWFMSAWAKELLVPQQFPTITAAVEAAQPGDTIRVDSGFYRERVIIDKSITLVGLGHDAVILAGVGQSPAVTVSNAQHVLIRGFTIQESFTGLLIQESQAIVIEQMRFLNNFARGIDVQSSGVTLQDAEILHTRPIVEGERERGIHIDQNSKARIAHNLIAGNARAGIVLDHTSQAEIIENQIMNTLPDDEGVGGRAISVQNGSIAMILRNKIAQNAERGIGVVLGSSAQIEGNIIAENVGTGIAIEEHSQAIISMNSIGSNRSRAIRVEKNSQATIIENSISENIGHGIFVTLASEASIQRNTITKTQPEPNGTLGRGIEISLDSRALILENTLAENRDDGIALFASRARLQANKITSNGDKGVAVSQGSEAELIDNLIQDNGDCGVFVDEKSTVIGMGNVITGNRGGDLCGNVPQSIKKM